MSYKNYVPLETVDIWLAEQTLLWDCDVEKTFSVTNASDWIKTFRWPSAGPLDIAETAKRVGVPVAYESLIGRKGATSGVTDEDKSPVKVYLSTDHADDMKTTYGHELGHIFLAEAVGVRRHHTQPVEAFCDYFGREMALPLNELPSRFTRLGATVLELMEQYTIGPEDAFFQLAK